MQTEKNILSLAPPAADARLIYGPDPNHFGDLRLPAGRGPHPLAVNIHGGFWRAQYDLTHAGHLCAALARAGVATWNLEYRRVGNPGGGWPGSFEDVTLGFRFLESLAGRFPLDLGRVVVMGHSAGGQMALCLAAHQPSLGGAVSLAGVLDLRRAFDLHLGRDAVVEFLGGTPQQIPEHYREASPLELSIKAPQRILHGRQDRIVPVEIARRYAEEKRRRGERVKLLEVQRAGHFELIDPRSAAWKTVESAVRELLV